MRRTLRASISLLESNGHLLSGCLTTKGHLAIDYLGPSWLRSCQFRPSCWNEGWSQHLQIQGQRKPLPVHSQPLHHGGSPTAVITTVCSLLIIVFLQEPKPQVKCFLSAHLQVLQHNYLDVQSLADNGEISQNTFTLSFSPCSLEIQLYWA